MTEPLLPIAEKAGKFAAQFCGFTMGGWWPTRKQAEDFARNAEPVVRARIAIEAESVALERPLDVAPRRHADLFVGPNHLGSSERSLDDVYSCVRCGGGPWYGWSSVPELCIPKP